MCYRHVPLPKVVNSLESGDSQSRTKASLVGAGVEGSAGGVLEAKAPLIGPGVDGSADGLEAILEVDSAGCVTSLPGMSGSPRRGWQ